MTFSHFLHFEAVQPGIEEYFTGVESSAQNSSQPQCGKVLFSKLFANNTLKKKKPSKVFTPILRKYLYCAL